MAGRIRLTIRGTRGFEALGLPTTYSRNSPAGKFEAYVRGRSSTAGGAVFLLVEDFYRRHGTLQPNRWSYHEAQGEEILRSIAFNGNTVLLESELDERGDAYADTVWIQFRSILGPTLKKVVDLRPDEFNQYGLLDGHPVFRIWWD
jgi:hypothetical protein